METHRSPILGSSGGPPGTGRPSTLPGPANADSSERSFLRHLEASDEKRSERPDRSDRSETFGRDRDAASADRAPGHERTVKERKDDARTRRSEGRPEPAATDPRPTATESAGSLSVERHP